MYKKSSLHNISFGIPMDATKTRVLMDLLPEVYNTSILTDEYRRYFETALGFWLSGGGRPDKKFDYYKYSSYMGGSLDGSVVDKHVQLDSSRAQGKPLQLIMSRIRRWSTLKKHNTFGFVKKLIFIVNFIA